VYKYTVELFLYNLSDKIGSDFGHKGKIKTRPCRHKLDIYIYTHTYIYIHTGCPRRNVPDFGRVFLMLKYTDITQNTYVQS